MTVMDERMSRLERVTVKLAAARRADNDAVVAAAGTPADKVAELRSRVHGTAVTAAATEPDPAQALRTRVHGERVAS
jgi:hypothetical protein